MRARYYHPILRRFISEDPSRFDGGNNFYAFAAGNPMTYLDPFGLGPVDQNELGFFGRAGEVALGYGIGLVSAIPNLIHTSGVGLGMAVESAFEGENPFGGLALLANPDVRSAFGDRFLAGLSNQLSTPRGQGKLAGELVALSFLGELGATRYITVGAAKGATPLLSETITSSGGRLGGTATRALNSNLAEQLIDQGYTITGGGMRAAEEFIRGAGGRGNTFVDLTAVNGSNVIRVQTVTTLADGVTPTLSEVAAAARIRAAFPNDTLILIPKP